MNKRHPQNRNLSLHTQSQFNGFNIIQSHGPLISNILDANRMVIDKACDEYARVCAMRVDLHLPPGFNTSDTAVITRCMESLKAQVKADLQRKTREGKRVYPCKVRFSWCREEGEQGNFHYHVLIVLNKDAYFCLGDFGATAGNMSAKIRKAWASALGFNMTIPVGLVHFCDNAVYFIDRNSSDYYHRKEALFHRVSYFAKAASKSYGDRKHSFGYSRY